MPRGRSGGGRSWGGGSRSPPPPARAPPPRAAPPPPPPPPPPPAAAAPAKAPGLMAQMAATAGGVAIGSTVGHVVGHALTSGGSEQQHQAPPAQAPPAQAYGEAPPQPLYASPGQQMYAGKLKKGWQHCFSCIGIYTLMICLEFVRSQFSPFPDGSPPPPAGGSSLENSPCGDHLKSLLMCTQSQPDISYCADISEALKQCRNYYGV